MTVFFMVCVLSLGSASAQTPGSIPVWLGDLSLGDSTINQCGSSVCVGSLDPGPSRLFVGSPNEVGIMGRVTSPTGNNTGVWGQTDSEGNRTTGVFGVATFIRGTTTGVWGRTSSYTDGAVGVFGETLASEGQSYGVLGRTSSSTLNSSGVVGEALGGATNGVQGINRSAENGATAVFGVNTASSGVTFGAWGRSLSRDGIGVRGEGASTGVHGVSDAEGTGVYGQGLYGVAGEGAAVGVSVGVFGDTDAFLGGRGVNGQAYRPSGIGVYGSNPSQDSNAYAGYFLGQVHVNGRLSKASGSFKIDHPLDPANKYLYHSFVESPDMMNIYDGVIALDGRGQAVIDLPEWFGALNRDFRYQLTCIGGFAPVYIQDEIVDNRFTIAGGRPGLKVSWQVTGIRQDAYANAHRIPVEEMKPEGERGMYLNPTLFGQPETKGIAQPLQANQTKSHLMPKK